MALTDQMNMRNVFLAVVASLPLSACKPMQPTYLAQPMVLDARGPYRHAPSGMIFPSAVAGFQRVNVTQYDAGGDDVGVGYNLVSPSESIAATIYVYPAPSLVSIGSPADVVASARNALCNAEFARRKTELVGAHPGARLIEERAAPPPVGDPGIPGGMAAFEYDDLFGGDRQPLHSELYVFCYVGGKWALEYRFTSPKGLGAEGRIASFIQASPWRASSR